MHRNLYWMCALIVNIASHSQWTTVKGQNLSFGFHRINLRELSPKNIYISIAALIEWWWWWYSVYRVMSLVRCICTKRISVSHEESRTIECRRREGNVIMLILLLLWSCVREGETRWHTYRVSQVVGPDIVIEKEQSAEMQLSWQEEEEEEAETVQEVCRRRLSSLPHLIVMTMMNPQ